MAELTTHAERFTTALSKTMSFEVATTLAPFFVRLTGTVTDVPGSPDAEPTSRAGGLGRADAGGCAAIVFISAAPTASGIAQRVRASPLTIAPSHILPCGERCSNDVPV